MGVASCLLLRACVAMLVPAYHVPLPTPSPTDPVPRALSAVALSRAYVALLTARLCVCALTQAVVHVYVPELFPDEAPTLMLQSVVHLVDRLPLCHTPPVMT